MCRKYITLRATLKLNPLNPDHLIYCNLFSLGEWMMTTEIVRERTKSESEEVVTEARGDPEMAPVYLQRLLPIFCSTYHSTMVLTVRYVTAGSIFVPYKYCF